jgi:hypothetical protein
LFSHLIEIGTNACEVKGFKNGNIELTYKVHNNTFNLDYDVSESGASTNKQKCISNLVFKDLNYQGFFGVSAGNNNNVFNDIDLKKVEFINLNAGYYQDTVGIEKRDYFKRDRD